MKYLFSLIICAFFFAHPIQAQAPTLKEQEVPAPKPNYSIKYIPSTPPNDSELNGALQSEDFVKGEDAGMGRFFTEFLNMIFALGLIIGLMLIIAWALKRMLNSRMQQMNVTSSIKILERRTLTPKAAIYLLDVCGKGVVIAESPSGLIHLVDVPLPSTDQVPEEKTAFGKILQDKLKKEP